MTLSLLGVHHIAIICTDYAVSKAFYTEILGLEIIREVHRAERDSYKLDLAVAEQYVIELFSFPTPPPRASQPEAAGLRHLAFAVADVDAAIGHLAASTSTTAKARCRRPAAARQPARSGGSAAPGLCGGRCRCRHRAPGGASGSVRAGAGG